MTKIQSYFEKGMEVFSLVSILKSSVQLTDEAGALCNGLLPSIHGLMTFQGGMCGECKNGKI